MGGLSPMHWLIVAGVSLAIVLIVVRAGTRRASLVLRSFDVRCGPRPSDEPYVEIVGRQAGVIAFLLTILQLQPQTSLRASRFGIEYETASLFGQTKKFIPLSRVASITAGIHKPVSYLIVAGFLLFFGAFFSSEIGSIAPLWFATLVAVILAVGYFILKSVLFEVTSNAALEISLRFRPGVIEGVPVDVSKALAAAGVIRDLILERSPGDDDESPPRGVGPPSNTYVGQPLSNAQSARHSPPPFFENVAPPVVNAATHTDAAHDEQEARGALREAVRLYKAGNRDAAATAMKRLIEEFPYTAAAATAQANLANMRKEFR